MGGGDLAFLAGLWHDAGKADPAWQQRLIECEKGERERIGLDHKCAGVLLAEEVGGAAGLAGLLIHAHHGGLGNRYKDFGPWLEHNRRLPGQKNALKALQAAIPDLANTQDRSFPAPETVGNELDAELFLRLTYSALIDADSLDTEAHKLGGKPPERGSAIAVAELWSRVQGVSH